MNTLRDSNTQTEETFPKTILTDPLSEETRKERRNLLGVSALGIIIIYTGLIPTKISALGVDFDKTDQSVILNILAATIGYFFVGFVLYFISDIWRFQVEHFLDTETYFSNSIKFNSEITNNFIKITDEHKQLTEEVINAMEDFDKASESLENQTKYVSELKQSETKYDKVREEAFQKQVKLRAEITKLDEKIKTLRNRSLELQKQSKLEDQKGRKSDEKETLRKSSAIILGVRLIFDIILPLGVGIWAIVILLWR